jgi:hypothetical protein
VASGNYRNGTELRKKPRRQFHYTAKIVVDGREPIDCAMSDVSHTGARVVLENDEPLPDRFILLLTRNGVARRRCRVVWRTGVSLGVEFAIEER